MTPIVHWDRCSNLRVTNDQGKNCSHHKVNPKIMGHTESGYLFLGGSWPLGLSIKQNSPNIDEVGKFFIFGLFSVPFEDVHTLPGPDYFDEEAKCHGRLFEFCHWQNNPVAAVIGLNDI